MNLFFPSYRAHQTIYYMYLYMILWLTFYLVFVGEGFGMELLYFLIVSGLRILI